MKPEIKYGLLAGAVTFLWKIAEFFLGIHDRYIDYYPVSSVASISVLIIFIAIALREKKKNTSGTLTLNQGMKCGSLISLAAAVIASAGTYVYYKAINPGWQAFMVEHRKKQLAELSATAEQIQFGVKIAQEYFSLQSALMQSFFGVIISGLLVSLAWSLVFKKNPAA